MAKPRVFVSSTYYDLRHIRNSLQAFIESLGYEAVLFESGDIPFHHDAPPDESCYGEIQNCHILVLIIGSRYGSPSSDSQPAKPDLKDKAYQAYNSITKREYETARERDIPIFIFVEKSVLAEYQTYKNNRDNATIHYHHVDSVNIYKLLDDILAQPRNNFVRDFEKFDDVSSWLRDQWAGLFADFLARRSTETTLKDLASQISTLGQISGVLKTYTESIIRTLQPDDSETIISTEEKKLVDAFLKSFENEGMIAHLLTTGKPKISPRKLFSAFRASKSLKDFLSKAGLSEDYINGFIKSFDPVANRDYARFMERYVGIKLPIDEPDSQRTTENDKH